MLLLSSNITSLTGNEFVFSGENFYSTVTSFPLIGEFHQRLAVDDNVADMDSGPAFVQFNISSASSGKQQQARRQEDPTNYCNVHLQTFL